MSRKSHVNKPPRPGELVTAACWCERGFVTIPIEAVQRGETATCFRVDCHPRAVGA